MVETSQQFSAFMYKYMEKMNCGSVGKTAKEFGVSRQQFYKWLNGGIPALPQQRNICITISKITNIPLVQLVEELVEIIRNSLLTPEKGKDAE